jgi:hypothetical protein
LQIHWVYMIKRDKAGNVQRFKARLVSGETHQIEDIDYQTTYEPTSHCGDVTMVLVITAKYNIEIHQIVQCLALLGVDLEEEIHMHPLQGYFRVVHTGSQYNNPRLTETLRKMVLRMRKSLYSLKYCKYGSIYISLTNIRTFLCFTHYYGRSLQIRIVWCIYMI